MAVFIVAAIMLAAFKVIAMKHFLRVKKMILGFRTCFVGLVDQLFRTSLDLSLPSMAVSFLKPTSESFTIEALFEQWFLR